jgi:type I restriction enzyme S subunit
LVTPGNFEIGGGFKEGNAKYFHGLYPEEFVFAPGDLIVTMTDLSKTADTLGYSAKIPREGNKIYLHNQRVGKVIAKSSDANLDFLYWVMRHKHYRNLVVSTATGSTVRHTSPSRILAYSFLLPPPSQQQAIAHILGTLDDKIELNRKTNETLEAMAKALFKSWFVDFDPVRAKAEGRPTGLPAEISDLFPDSFEDSELGEIPSGWRVTPVGDVVECVGGSTPSTSEADYLDGGEHFWATPKDLSSLSEPFLLDTATKITADGVQRISSGILPVGTVLLSSRAPVGYVAAACVPVSINQGFIAFA